MGGWMRERWVGRCMDGWIDGLVGGSVDGWGLGGWMD